MNKLIASMMLSSVAAFALQIYPIPVVLEHGKKYREFVIDEDSGKYQVYLKKWTQKNGEDILQDTKEVVAYPKIIQAPKKIKVYKKRNNLIPTEQAYRLILKELNINPVEGETKVLKTLSIPVFISPSSSKPLLELECKQSTLKLINRGNTHFKILSINEDKGVSYILPNQIKEVKHVKKDGTVHTNRGDYKYQCK